MPQLKRILTYKEEENYKDTTKHLNAANTLYATTSLWLQSKKCRQFTEGRASVTLVKAKNHDRTTSLHYIII